MAFKPLVLAGAFAFASGTVTSQPVAAQELCPKGYQLVMGGSGKKLTTECVRVAELAERNPGFYEEDSTFKYSVVHAKIEKAHVPKKGMSYTSYKESKALVNSWTEKELDSAVAELNGSLPSSTKKTVKSIIKYWALIKFHSEEISRRTKRNLDPRSVVKVILAENAGDKAMDERNPIRGAAGEGSIMQVMPGTAKFMYKLHSKYYPYYQSGKPHHLGENALVNGMMFLLDGLSAFDCEHLRYDQISAEKETKVYHFYNKGTEKARVMPTWQQENYANSVKYMFAYDFIEQKNVLKLDAVRLASNKKAEIKVAIAKSVQKPVEQKPTEQKPVQNVPEVNVAKVPSEVKSVKTPADVKVANVPVEAKVTEKPVEVKVAKTPEPVVSFSSGVVLHTDFIAQEQSRKAKVVADAKVMVVASIVEKLEPEQIIKTKPSSVNTVTQPKVSRSRSDSLDADIKRLNERLAKLSAVLNSKHYAANLRKR